MPRIAVVLAGCGRGDGSEIHESVSMLVHLDRCGASYRCFAPDAPQADVVNHATGKPASEERNCLVEAARISRGEISPIGQLRGADFDGLMFPGGFGAAKNLCSFARDGDACSVLPDVTRVIKEFHALEKPIGLACIAPVIAARVLGTALGGPGCSVTIGSDAKTATAVRAMGAQHAETSVIDAHVDERNRIVTTPAYMCDSGPWGVFTGIGRMVDEVLALCGAAARA